MSSATRQCDQCDALIEVHDGYQTWCECGWNLVPRQVPRSGLLAGLYSRLDRARSQSLFEDALQDNRSSSQIRRIALQLLCLAILMTIPACLVGGIALIRAASDNPIAWFVGLILVGISALLRPRFESLEASPLDPEECPELRSLVCEVADKLGAPEPDYIVLNSDFNACVYSVGWRHERVLELGVPLLAALGREETVAVVSHEMGHVVSKDPTRSILCTWSMRTLTTWAYLWTPGDDSCDGSLDGLLGAAIAWTVSLVPRGVATLITNLTYDDSQRAEYRADRLGAGISGSSGFVSLLRTFSLQATLDLAAQRVALRTTDLDVITEFRKLTAEMPEREWERLLRVGELEASRIDDTHPPTHLRVQALMADLEKPRLVLSESRKNRLELEIAPYHDIVSKQLSRAHRAALYN